MNMKPNPYRAQRLMFGSLRARQSRAVQKLRLKAMNDEFKRIRRNYDDFTRYNKPSREDIERKFPKSKEERRVKNRAELFQEKIYVRPRRTVKNVAEEVLSNYQAGNYSEMNPDIQQTYFCKGYYL